MWLSSRHTAAASGAQLADDLLRCVALAFHGGFSWPSLTVWEALIGTGSLFGVTSRPRQIRSQGDDLLTRSVNTSKDDAAHPGIRDRLEVADQIEIGCGSIALKH
jgi:hypothetical protein